MVLALFRSAHQFDGSVIVYFLEKKELRQKQSLTGKAKLKLENIELCLTIHKPLVEKQARLKTGAGNLPDHHDHHVPVLRPGHQAHRGLLPALGAAAVHLCALLTGGQ